jgi:hypothetical protein
MVFKKVKQSKIQRKKTLSDGYIFVQALVRWGTQRIGGKTGVEDE